MASTIEVFLSGLALLINTLTIFILYFITNSFLAPFVQGLAHIVGVNQVIPIGQFTYIFPFIFSFLLISEIVCIIAFFVVIGRRTTYDDYA